MHARILVAHASRAGSTAEVAEMIGQILRDSGTEIDIRPVNEAPGAAGYNALVLGSAIWVGKPLPEAVQFAAAQKDAIARITVAYFILCDALKDDTPSSRRVARMYVDPLVRIKEPVSLGLFAGARDLSKVRPLLRWLLLHAVRLQEGDWRDWDAIRAWAADLPARLETPARAAVAAG